MIVITGATGALNGATVEHLLKRIPADEIGVSVRDVAKAQRFADRGVRVRRGAYADPAVLLDSFEGADQVLLVSANDPSVDGVALARVGIDAGVAGTSLRNGFYAHSLDWLLGPWREAGVIATPADGPVSWTERDDEAEAAAVILAGPRPFDGPVTLTASTAVTFDQIAGITSQLTGRDIQRVVLDDDTWVAEQIVHGTPAPMAGFLLGFYQAARQGRFAAVDPLLADLLGRQPCTVRDLLADRAAA